MSLASSARSTRAITDTTVTHYRVDKYQAWVDTINKAENGFDAFSRGYETYGFQVLKNGDISYREWAPNAETAALVGDFSE